MKSHQMFFFERIFEHVKKALKSSVRYKIGNEAELFILKGAFQIVKHPFVF